MRGSPTEGGATKMPSCRAIASSPQKFALTMPTKALPPEAHRFMADVDAALVEQILHIPQALRVPHVHHHYKANDVGRAVEIAGWLAVAVMRPSAEAHSAASKFGLAVSARPSSD